MTLPYFGSGRFLPPRWIQKLSKMSYATLVNLDGWLGTSLSSQHRRQLTGALFLREPFSEHAKHKNENKKKNYPIPCELLQTFWLLL